MNATTQDLEIVYRPIADLTPYEKNARTHDDKQVDQIVASMQELGFTNPILIDDDCVIIAGHGRRLAALKLDLASVPTVMLKGLSEAQRKAAVLMDNKLAENAGWDIDTLRDELHSLQIMDFDLSTLGFSDKDLKQMLNVTKDGLTDPDAAPPLPEEPSYVEMGDIFTLGNHRLMCGDATDAHHVMALLDGERPHLMVTDPPYGVNYDPNWRKGALGQEVASTGKVLNDDKADWREAWNLFPGDVAYVWHGALHTVTVADSLQAAAFGLRAQIIWVKSRMAISRGHYHWHHEPCIYAVRTDPEHEVVWYAVKDGATGSWAGDRSQTTVWKFEDKAQDVNTIHGTQKPVEAMKRPMQNNSLPGDGVYEPFCGSGTTIIAAEIENRRCFAMELDPAYCEVIIERWENFTGKKAKKAPKPKEV